MPLISKIDIGGNLIGGVPYCLAASEPKLRLAGLERACPPEETFKRVARLFQDMGLTRLADVTTLDRVGLPVFQAIRPMARSVSVKQGKGRTVMAAKVSAAMEAAEAWHAETLPHDSIAERLGAHDVHVEDEALIHASGGRADPSRIKRWVCGWDLIGGRAIWAPFDCISMDFAGVSDRAGLFSSSNGLASGNTLAEAVASGLYEVIERDALGEFDQLGVDEQAGRHVPREMLEAMGCQELLERFDSAQLVLDVHDMTNNLAVSAYRARLSNNDRSGVPTQIGLGCHLNPSVAVSRAITEAAQARVTLIAGGRDDLLAEHYNTHEISQATFALRKLASMTNAHSSVVMRENESTETSAGDIRAMIARLLAQGITALPVFDLSKPQTQIYVSKVFLPELGQLVPGLTTLRSMRMS